MYQEHLLIDWKLNSQKKSFRRRMAMIYDLFKLNEDLFLNESEMASTFTEGIQSIYQVPELSFYYN